MAHEMQMGDDGILRVKFWGDFEQADVDAYMADFQPILEQVTGKIHFLVEVSGVGKASSGARKLFGEMFRDPDPRTGKTALLGANRYVRVVAGFVIKITSGQNMRLFDSEEKALAWLKEDG
jgi:hypothetical protein